MSERSFLSGWKFTISYWNLQNTQIPPAENQNSAEICTEALILFQRKKDRVFQWEMCRWWANLQTFFLLVCRARGWAQHRWAQHVAQSFPRWENTLRGPALSRSQVWLTPALKPHSLHLLTYCQSLPSVPLIMVMPFIAWIKKHGIF